MLGYHLLFVFVVCVYLLVCVHVHICCCVMLDWAYNLPRGEPCLEKWRAIPTGTDIVVTHGGLACSIVCVCVSAYKLFGVTYTQLIMPFHNEPGRYFLSLLARMMNCCLLL